MYENIIAIHNVLKKKTIQLNFQPAQYLKKLAKIILNQNFFFKKKQEKEKPAATVNIPRVLEYFIIYIYSFHAYQIDTMQISYIWQVT